MTLTQDEQIVIKCRRKHGQEILRVSLMSEIPEHFLAALALHESYPKLYIHSTRFELHIFKEVYRKEILNGPDCLNYASSFGLCQVLGAHSRQYRIAGKSKYIGQSGTLNYDLLDFWEKPFEVAAAFIQYNARQYVDNKDWESIARLYNSGSPKRRKLTDAYWASIFKYMKLYEICLQQPIEELPHV